LHALPRLGSWDQHNGLRGSSQGLVALRNFNPASVSNGSFSTEATAPGKRVDVGCWPDSSGPFHRRRFVGQCHNRLRAIAASSYSLDHLVGAAEQRQRESKTERLRSLEIDDQINFRDLLHR
jgi:hypothetical protein